MRVQELMLPLDRSLIEPTATLAEAYLRLLDHQLTCLVLDEQPRSRIVRMRGIMELISGSVLHGQSADPERAVAIVSERVETVPVGLPVELAAKRLWRRPSRALLVADPSGEAVGLVGWPQLNRFFDEMLDVEGGDRLEIRLDDHPGALAQVLAAASKTGANVQATFLSHRHGGARVLALYVGEGEAEGVRRALGHLGADVIG